MNRRTFVSSGCSAVVGAVYSEEAVAPTGISSQQEPLAFGFDALEPYFDAKTMRDHYDKIHAHYAVKLRETLRSSNLRVANIVSLLPAIKTLPTPRSPNSVINFGKKPGPLPEQIQAELRDNAGGHVNHTVFWRFLAPPGSRPSDPEKPVASSIQAEFGSISKFKLAFTEAAMKHKGNGWAWLVYRPDGRLVITTTSNNDHPLMKDFVPAAESGRAVLCLDLWEHAYAGKYKGDRQKYIAAWWNVVDWTYVTKAFAIARSTFASAAPAPSPNLRAMV